MSIAASYLARRAAQKERVRILYRRALKDTLNWAVHRHLFYPDADALRERFETNKHVEDVETIDRMIADGEATYNKWRHPDPYIVPWAPGGSKFTRNPTPPAGVGVTGFCMGGALALASSVLVPEVDAVVSFYGVPPPELADPVKAKAPVQAHFGELDNMAGFSDVKTANALEEKLKTSGVPHEVYIYPGINHAFMNRSPEGKERRKAMGMDDDNEAAAELAWSRFQSWMSRYLST